MARKRRSEPPPVRVAVPEEQVPWVTDVAVVSITPGMVVLRRPGAVTARVKRDGNVELEFSSQSLVSDYMMRDLTRTEELQRRFFQTESDPEWLAWLRHWVEPPPAITVRAGALVTEWPGGAAAPPRRAGELGMSEDSTQWNEPFFKGSKFRFAHFKTPQGEEGAVIQWWDQVGNRFEPPIVYLGDFSGFMALQSFDDPENPAEWLEFNELFENTFMWALERMGSFDEPWTLRPEVVEAVVEDPEILLTESVAKMLPRLEEYRTEAFREAVRDAAEARGLR